MPQERFQRQPRSVARTVPLYERNALALRLKNRGAGAKALVLLVILFQALPHFGTFTHRHDGTSTGHHHGMAQRHREQLERTLLVALSASGKPLAQRPPSFHEAEEPAPIVWLSLARGEMGLRGLLPCEHTHFETDANTTAQEAGPGRGGPHPLPKSWQATDLPRLVAARVLNPSARGPPRA